MNKKTLRIAGWALGLSMAVAGIGTIATLNTFNNAPIAVNASGGTATLNPNNASTSGTTVGIWKYTPSANGGTAPAVNSSQLRLYAKNTFTISTTSDTVTKIDSIVYTVSVNANSKGKYPEAPTSSNGTISFDSDWSTGNHVITIDNTAANCKSITFTLGGSAGNINVVEVNITYTPAATTQTISGDTEAYTDETVTLTSNADSPTWSIVDGDTTADGAAVTSAGVVSVSGAGDVKVKAVKSGYTDAYHTITFSERPSTPYLSMAQDSYAKWVGDDDFSVSFTYGNIENANVGDITFESNHPEYADVKGDISASDGAGTYTIEVKAAGTATFTVSYGGNELDVFEVVVTAKSISITLDKSTATLWEGKTLTLTPTVEAVGYSTDVIWESNDTAVATVSNGVVTPVAAGTATIKCKSADYPSEYASCVVTVKFLPTNYFDLDLTTNKTTSATASALTWDRTYANITISKEESSTNANNYYGGDSNNRTSTRFYAKSVLTIDNTDNCSAVSFTATTSGYATALANSTWSNATAVASDTNVMVYVTDPSEDFSCTIGGTCGFSTIRFYVDKSWSEDFLDTFTCSGVTVQNPNGAITVADSATTWGAFQKSFAELPSAVRSDLKGKAAGDSDTDAQAAERYDLVVRKYGTVTYPDFIGRFSEGGANAAGAYSAIRNNATDDNAALAITLILGGAALGVGSFIAFRKKKED